MDDSICALVLFDSPLVSHNCGLEQLLNIQYVNQAHSRIYMPKATYRPSKDIRA